jgi:hypothetical protein
MQRARSVLFWRSAGVGRMNALLNVPLFFDAKRAQHYRSRATVSSCLTKLRKRVQCSTRMLRQFHGTNDDQNEYLAAVADTGMQLRYHQRLSS